MEHWQLQEAKARMSELVKRAQAAPQGITLHGKPANGLTPGTNVMFIFKNAAGVLHALE